VRVEGFAVAAWAVFLLVPLFFGAIVVILVVTFSTKSAPLPADPGATVRFYARVLPRGEVLSPIANVSSANNGMLTVTPTHVQWDPREGAPWAVAIPSISVGATHGASSLSGRGLDIEIEGSGAWRLDVSDRPINRFVRNTAKSFREADAARKLAGLLVARGARLPITR
jgi:hypothetical protein